MHTMVDSNVLIDIAYRDPQWRDWSAGQIRDAARSGLLFINPVIYSEFSYRFEAIDDVDAVLDPEEFRREPLPFAAAFAAAQAFRIYRAKGGARQRVLPDFFIGAHAAIRGYRILTRDPSGYRAYFPDLDIIAPDTHP